MSRAPLGFVTLVGLAAWAARIEALRALAAAGTRYASFAAQRFAAEFAIEKSRRGIKLHAAEQALVEHAEALAALHRRLPAAGRARLAANLAAALDGNATIIPLLHLVRTAALQERRGFAVSHTGLVEGAPHDLLITRDGAAAELACETVSAEDGHALHRAAWMTLVDRIDPDLQTWLAAHPGRYVLKMTLPRGLKTGDDPCELAALQARITALLATARRADHDEAAVLRLDPLLLAGAQAPELGMVNRLRAEFGPEAHIAITGAGPNGNAGGVLALAARGGADNDVGAMLRRRMAAAAPARFTGTRPGILAMFLDDTDRLEWRLLRERLEIEGEARQFLTTRQARAVVAVTCASRIELCGTPDAAPEGDLRFRNPQHRAASSAALAPAVVSTV
jgi:hypothetical protein